MAGRQPDAQGRAQQDLALQALAVGEVGDDHQADIEFAADQEMFEIAALVLDDPDREFWKTRRKRARRSAR